ncbi:MAG: HAD-IA family hydrolase [Pseudomonadota bacterium]
MTEPLRLVIFDIDGTLVDSQAHILASMRYAFGALGRTTPDRTDCLGVIGLSLPQAMAVLAPEAGHTEIARLTEAYKESWTALGQEREAPALFPGAREALASVEASGALISAATGKSRRGLDRMLAETGLAPLFFGTQTADDAASKPHPEMVLNCLAATGVAPEHAVMVGDTEFDIEMARAAGCRAIGVGWGYHSRARLAAQGPEEILSDFSGLMPALRRIWGSV